ncbi:MAG: hypothetical protein WCJ30_07855, partial [Deltaproteobacteria bacterium]
FDIHVHAIFHLCRAAITLGGLVDLALALRGSGGSVPRGLALLAGAVVAMTVAALIRGMLLAGGSRSK